MSRIRQTPFLDPRGRRGAQITTLIYDYPTGYVVPRHYHDRDQLVYASRGVMTVQTHKGAWVVPTQRAVWIPARVPHGIHMSGAVSMRTLYFKTRLVRSLPRSCCVVNVSPLLKELILHACAFPALGRKVAAHSHLIDVIIDQLRAVRAIPLQLPNPFDPRAMRVAEGVLLNPGDQRPLKEICRKAGASKRTIERLFLQETSLTFGKWRQQFRLMHAMQLIAEGVKVTRAAFEAGYSTPSAFIAMFRRVLGTTPSRYFGTR